MEIGNTERAAIVSGPRGMGMNTRILETRVALLLVVAALQVQVARGQTPEAAAGPPITARQAGTAASPDPITGSERVNWIVSSTVGPESLMVGVLSAGWGTWHGSPPEYGEKVDGFAKRYGMRLTGVSVGNAIEGSLGAAWGEDPRYRRAPGRGLFSRVGHAAKLTVMAPRADGRLRPAYARYAGNVGNNFITNAWRVESESSVEDALVRSAIGIAGRFSGNLFDEFWPDVRRLLFGAKHDDRLD